MEASEIIVDKKINLLLNTEEAIWLKGILQNPLHTTYANESETDKEMRELFWNALDMHFPNT